MTLVQTQARPASSAPLPRPVAAAVDTAGPQVCDDMTIEVALAVMAGARTEHLLVCDNDSLCTGLVTKAQLTAIRDSPTYTDRFQLRDILDTYSPFTTAVTTAAKAPHALRGHQPGAPPVIDNRDSARGVLAPACAC
ncbi:hypothetical protein [Streptomyces sp. NPDC127033]|uniref:hypothetical protein n=1 Tax=Streptomyces sp. NPDC127033 TaxID=3347110 RepID=UPI0036693008